VVVLEVEELVLRQEALEILHLQAHLKVIMVELGLLFQPHQMVLVVAVHLRSVETQH
jgi:hypothetical protein